jgi:DNA repair protein RecN (Recombination protein N)
MLALKTAACSDEAGRTLVFDEVDAGIGGRVADVVGRRLKGLGERFQVLCVTHLPQIAVYGSGQIEIRKVVNEGRTLTTAERVSGSERVDAIAAMMGTGKPTVQSRRNAAELLKGAQ